MNLLRTVAALSAVAALAAGCNDDSEPVPEKTTPVTRATDGPTDEPTEAPSKPVLPDAATKPTKAGAEAFIHYYWDVVNYAQATGNVKLLSRIASATCDTCAGVVDGLRKIYRSGGAVRGGLNTVDIRSTAQERFDDSDAFVFKIRHRVSHEPQTIIDANGGEDPRDSGANDFIAFVTWTASQWRLDVLELGSA